MARKKKFWEQTPIIVCNPGECVWVYLMQIHVGYYCTQGNGIRFQRSMLPQSEKKIPDLVVPCFHEVVLPWRAALESLSSEVGWIP